MATRPESESPPISMVPAVLFIGVAVLIFLGVMSAFDYLDKHPNDQTTIVISQ